MLDVDDILVKKTFIGVQRFPITRVTKTLAKSKLARDGYEYAFKREISHNMSHPHDQWSTAKYRVIKK